MIYVTIVNLIVLAILILGERLKVKTSLMPGVVMILIMAYGIRYDYGNDYLGYQNIFYACGSSSLNSLQKMFPRLELGWMYLNKLFSGVDFSVFVFFLTFIQFTAVGWFIGRYVNRQYQWMILAIYLFTPSMMLTQLSMLRQGLVIQMVLFGYYFIEKKQPLLFLLLTLLATRIHTSAYAAMPMIFLPYLSKINYKWMFTIFVALFLFFHLETDIVSRVFNDMASNDEFEKYSFYVNGKVIYTRTGIGYAYQIILALYMIFITKWKTAVNKQFIVSALIVYVTMPLTFTIGLVARLIYYYGAVGLPAYAAVLKRARKDPGALILMAVYFFYVGQNYIKFFYDPVWTRKFLHFHTIFD